MTSPRSIRFMPLGLALAALGMILFAAPAPVAGQRSAGEGEGASEGRGAARGRRGRPNLTQASLKIGEQWLRISYGKAPVEGRAFKDLDSLKTGEIVRFLDLPAIKVRAEMDLKFGDTIFKTENITKNYPGIYSLWIKKAQDGWRLVFNSEGDIWGTQHNPQADVGEVPLTYARTEASVATLTLDLKEVAGGGSLKITWGPHEWNAAFQAGAPMPSPDGS